MSDQDRLISDLRRGLSDAETDLMDNLLTGRVDRRGFLAHGSRLGLSLPLLGGLAGVMGLAAETRPAQAAGPSGGTLRVGMTLPTGAIDPITIADQGGLFILEQAGEFLIKLSPDYILVPVLATSWSPNTDGSVWTFKLRSGVKFNNGEPFNADAVVTSVERLVDPKNGSNALSAFKGVLSPGASHKVDDLTVEFHLDAPNGNFPYVLSSDNYNLVMLPASYTAITSRASSEPARSRSTNTSPRWALLSCATTPIGGRRRCWTVSSSPSSPIWRPRFWPCRAARSTCWRR